MIDFASTSNRTSPDAVPYLKLMAAVIALAVSHATEKPLPKKLPKKTGDADMDKKAERKAREHEGRRLDIEREAQSAITFIFGNDGKFSYMADCVGFEPDAMRQALLVPKPNLFSFGQYDDSKRRILRWRLGKLGYDVQKYTTGLEN